MDGSLRLQTDFLEQSEAVIQPLESWGPRLRYICRRQVRQSFERRLNAEQSGQLTFYGSGDFHHLTLSLLKFHPTPLSVIVFDQHPDWDVTSPIPCCGSWVNEALALPWVERVVVIGAGEEDLGGYQLWRGNRAALASGQLEIYPATLASSLWPGTQLRLPCGTRKGGLMQWETVAERGMETILEGVMSRLESRRVYVSVDKDCLAPECALSNWDAGELSLEEVCLGIGALKEECEIIGADVTGEWSAPRFESSLVAAISRADHPQKPQPTSQQLSINERTNLALWRAIDGA